MTKNNITSLRCFSRKISKPIDCSNPMRPDYQIATDDNGCEYLVKIGDHNQYEEIQSYSDAVNFDRILERIALGDTSMLRPITDANFYDSSVLPDSPFEIIKLKNDNIEKFNQLPSDIRALFNNNVQEFYNSIVDKSIDGILENYSKQKSTDNSNNSTDNGGANK